MVSWFSVQILWSVLFGFSAAFSHRLTLLNTYGPPTVANRRRVQIQQNQHPAFLLVRGGQQQEHQLHQDIDVIHDEPVDDSEGRTLPTIEKQESNPVAMASALPMTLVHRFGQFYAKSLQSYPIRTKSITACAIFALSDIMAQRLEKSDSSSSSSSSSSLQWSRIMASALVGLLYFGPAAHFWYEWIFRILPGTSLVSTLQKAALGQLIFGPCFTCIFFASSLLQSGTFSLSRWWDKIRTDLPGAWLAGAGFWPVVDLISYSLIAPQWIPLFVNLCSLVWTTYLVLKSYSTK
jgi:protein Mpv17